MNSRIQDGRRSDQKAKLGAIGGKQELKPPLEMPLQVIGKRAEEDVAFDRIITLVTDEPHSLEIEEGLLAC